MLSRKKIRLQLFTETGSATFPPCPCSSLKLWICSLCLLRRNKRAWELSRTTSWCCTSGQRCRVEGTDNSAKGPYCEPPFCFFVAQLSGLDESFRRTNGRQLCTQILMVWLEICTTTMPMGDDSCLMMPTLGSVCSGLLV